MPALSAQLRTVRAIQQVEEGSPVASASRNNRIDRSYLKRRIKGVPTREEVDEGKQTLSSIQEAFLADWAIVQGRLGHAPRLTYFKTFAQGILNTNGARQALGRNWYARFLKRNPNVKSIRSTMIDYKRANGVTPENINIFFDRLDDPALAPIPPRFWYNADEMGVFQGHGDNGLVVGEAYRKRILVKDPTNLTWITMLECTCADGSILPPLIIFAGSSVQQQWFPDDDDDRYRNWHFTTSTNGWTNQNIAVKWLREVFIPHTQPEDPNQWRVIVLDGHNSHTTEEFMELCVLHKIYLLFLCPHTSHVCQPNDLGLFPNVKGCYKRKLRMACFFHLESFPGKEEFLYAYYLARQAYAKPKYILSGWKAAGIWPRDREKILQSHWVTGADRASATRPSKPVFPIQSSPRFDEIMAGIYLSTPKSSRDLVLIEQALGGMNNLYRNPTVRLLFRKLGKALDLQTAQLTEERSRTAALTEALKKTKPKKRKAVHEDPQSTFVRIMDVKKVKVGMGLIEDAPAAQEIPDSQENGEESDTSVREEIVVQTRYSDSENGSNWSDN